MTYRFPIATRTGSPTAAASDAIAPGIAFVSASCRVSQVIFRFDCSWHDNASRLRGFLHRSYSRKGHVCWIEKFIVGA
jgi:hypothetical protein